jgi:hypothetical protein
MTTRIIFNGQGYPGTEAMPENVRDAYLKALALLKDAEIPRKARWERG